MSQIEDMARCLAVADGHDPDLLCRLDIPPPYKINTRKASHPSTTRTNGAQSGRDILTL